MIETTEQVVEQTTQAEAPATPVQAQTPAAVPASNPNELTDAGSQMKTILTMIQEKPELLKDPEYKQIHDNYQDFLAKQKTEQEKAAGKTTTTETETETETEEETPEEKPKSIFFKEGSKKAIEVKSVDDLNKIVKENYGMDSVDKFFKQVPAWRKDAEGFHEVSDQVAKFDKLFESLPDPIYEAIDAFTKGKDWTEPLKNAPLAFDKGWDELSAKQKNIIVRYYSPTVTTEQLDEPNEATKTLIDAARVRHSADKQISDSRRADIDRRAGERKAAFSTSYKSSVESFRETFPDFSAEDFKQVDKLVRGGDFNPLFFKQDGTLKPEAVKMVALALYGEREISSRVNSATKSVRTQKLMVEVDKGKKQLESTKSVDTTSSAFPPSMLKGWNATSPYAQRPQKE